MARSRAKTLNLVIVVAAVAPKTRQHWRRALEDSHLVYTVKYQSQLEQALQKLRPDVLALQLGSTEFVGLKQLATIQQLNVTMRIIILGKPPNDRAAVAAINAGARGYCIANGNSVLINKAVEAVAEGELWAPRRIISRLVDNGSRRTQNRIDLVSAPTFLSRMTPRQLEIARLVATGATNKQIAQTLSITESAIKAHMTSIFRKLKISDRTQLAVMVAQQNSLA